MGKKLYITEKPSVAASFASVLGLQNTNADRGRGYVENQTSIISWCFGHLVTLAYPDAYDPAYKSWKIEHLPIIPKEYKYKVIENTGTKKQFEVIKQLMNRSDVDIIYSCTDSGREGEYIFRLVYQQSGTNKPAKRVWISSHTDEAVKKGIEEAKDLSEYDSLAKAAYCRAKEDWLFGMNFSRIYTCQYGKGLANYLKENKRSVIAIGRVMTCVLGLVVERELEIRNFVPKVHYGVMADFQSQESNVTYKGKWQPPTRKVKNTDKDDEEEKYLSQDEAQAIIDKLQGHEAFVKKVEIKVKKEQPPLLFNLAELQSEANKKFKLPVDKTLEIAQSLYEKKLISYPRTDSRVMSTDVIQEIPKVLKGLSNNGTFSEATLRIKDFGKLSVNKSTKRFVDDSKVTDHYAIIPTYMTSDLSRMNQDSRNVYSLIVKRFLAIFYPVAEFNTVKVETDIKGEVFVTNSKTLKEAGWKEVYEVSPAKSEEEVSTSPIHMLIKKENCEVTKFKLEQKETKPPSRFSDGSLVLTMEKAGKYIENEELREQIKTCGIGTSATRAGIIKKLQDIGHIKINPKSQIVTPEPKGEAIVELLRRSAKELLNPILTASWEKGLLMIQNKETTEKVFDEKLVSYITRTIDRVKKNKGIHL
ncbi:MAG: DNA topoisomerase III [Firmicutes bacterium HGW-Firmicutes-12]|nr:MAG: DNA topoisomerase III [Firmicutes bacterium HGW-Firmicutes-12]